MRDPQVHLEVLEHFLEHAANADFTVKDITLDSPGKYWNGLPFLSADRDSNCSTNK